MKIGLTRDGFSIAGQVPDQATADAISAYAIATVGGDAVDVRLQIVSGAAPRRWQIATLAVIDQLSLGGGGRAEIGGYRIKIETGVLEPVYARVLHDELLSGLPDYTVTTVYWVDLPARLAAIPMPAPRCAARLGEIHAKRLIEFSTGSARITKESGAVLDALAASMQRCNADPIEVAGHTDSQGAEDLNLRISQARAEAVVKALVQRGIAPARLVARGYGESKPVASNQTEEGRGRNRRIEFTAVSPPSDPEATGSVETGGAADAATATVPDGPASEKSDSGKPKD